MNKKEYIKPSTIEVKIKGSQLLSGSPAADAKVYEEQGSDVTYSRESSVFFDDED